MNQEIGILFVEDHPFQQTVLIKLAKAQGLVPHVVSTSAAALQELSTTDRYNIVIMDRNLKGDEDGLACTGKIRALDKERSRRTIVIGLSADAEPKHKYAALSAGMDDYYAKPMNAEKLQEILHRWQAKST
jgi:CheY-like chemotaxis protein